MGWGDELIASGQARVMHQASPGKVAICGRDGRFRQHDMWRGNPRIARHGDALAGTQMLHNGPGLRPYIREKTATRWYWNEWECPVGEIYFSPEETAFAARHEPGVIVEPHHKANASPNKDWGMHRWQALVTLMRAAGLKVSQMGPSGTRLLEGAAFIETPDFRHGCAVLARARAAVLPEGGLHHAAAALGVGAVVIFGGFISPKQTGYVTQTNLFTGGTPCGWRTPCAHCAEAMAQITPELVFEKLGALL
jgi:hypothetical protein